MAARVVVGYGTGRCGTKSLAEFLDMQCGYVVTHEQTALSWYPAFTDVEMAVSDFFAARKKAGVAGDVSFSWIHYLPWILRRYEGARAINIRRDLDEVIESFWSYLSWDVAKPGLPGEWYGYPFDSCYPTKDAVAYTMRRYRYMEVEVAKHFPGSIYLMRMEDLNDLEKLSGLMGWLGETDYLMRDRIHTNTRDQVLSTRNDRGEPGRLFKTFRKGVTEHDRTNKVS